MFLPGTKNTNVRGIDEKVSTPRDWFPLPGCNRSARAVQHVQWMGLRFPTCLDLKISSADTPWQFDGQSLCQVRHPEAQA